MVHFVYQCLPPYRYFWKALEKIIHVTSFLLNKKYVAFSIPFSRAISQTEQFLHGLVVLNLANFGWFAKVNPQKNFWQKNVLAKWLLVFIKLRNFFLCERKPSLKIWNFLVSKIKYLNNLWKQVLAKYSFFCFWFCKNQPSSKLPPLRFLQICAISIQSSFQFH